MIACGLTLIGISGFWLMSFVASVVRLAATVTFPETSRTALLAGTGVPAFLAGLVLSWAAGD